MTRIPQIIHVIVQEKETPREGILADDERPLTTDEVRAQILRLAKMPPHPKYFGRITHFTQPHPHPKGQRVWNATVVRP